MKVQTVYNVIIGIALSYLFVTNEVEHNRTQKEIKILKCKIDCLEQDVIGFENMHSDHYDIEENVIPMCIEPKAAKRYKEYIDSIMHKYRYDFDTCRVTSEELCGTPLYMQTSM
ncbi:MAG: hypothetical protein NC248_05220 [Bacteroides sp.]|nr:hypothetical protein [Bacteroides sp.]MCM1389401.1 hypothetical protein [Bacteroides sp.]